MTPVWHGVAERLCSIGLVTILWLISFLQKKSLGAAFCLLEVRKSDGGQPSSLQMLVRSGPIYALAVICMIPRETLPAWLDHISQLLSLVMLLGVIANGIIGIITHSSLLDRVSKTVVFQIDLPGHIKPRIFGIRIM